MAFPTIPTVAAGRILYTLNTAGGATKTFPNLTDITKNAGDLLIAICVEYDGNSTDAEFSSWGGSFSEVGDRAGTATMAIGVAYKISTGSETGTFTVTTADASTNDSVMILLSIPGAHASTAPEVSVMTVNTNAVVPAVGTALNPTNWDAEDTLWIAVGGSGEDSTSGSYTAITGAPANYSSYSDSGITADVVGGAEAAVAFRQLNAASEAPGAWSGDSTLVRGAAVVIAVRPAAIVLDPLVARLIIAHNPTQKSMQASAVLASTDLAPNPLISRLVTAYDPAQKEMAAYIAALYPLEIVENPVFSRLVKAHDPLQREMQAFSLLPTADELPPETPPIAVDIPPISQVITSGHGW
jgi:hypothetical protein